MNTTAGRVLAAVAVIFSSRARSSEMEEAAGPSADSMTGRQKARKRPIA
jgi:hypothetical protein